MARTSLALRYIFRNEVEATKSEQRCAYGGLHLVGLRHVALHADRHIAGTEFRSGGRSFLLIQIGDDDAGALGHEPSRNRLTDAPHTDNTQSLSSHMGAQQLRSARRWALT